MGCIEGNECIEDTFDDTGNAWDKIGGRVCDDADDGAQPTTSCLVCNKEKGGVDEGNIKSIGCLGNMGQVSLEEMFLIGMVE